MARKMNLQATSADLDHLWDAVNKTREGTSVIKLNREVVVKLLLDHGKLLNYLHGSVQ